jgi:hypothetical protein
MSLREKRKSEVRRLKAEGRRQKAEGRRQKAEGRRHLLSMVDLFVASHGNRLDLDVGYPRSKW